MYFVLSYKIHPHPPPDTFAPRTDLSPRFFDFHFSFFRFHSPLHIQSGDNEIECFCEFIWSFKLFFILLHYKKHWCSVCSLDCSSLGYDCTDFLYLIFFEVFFCCLEKYTYLCSAEWVREVMFPHSAPAWRGGVFHEYAHCDGVEAFGKCRLSLQHIVIMQGSW